ncbi:hypothetical protein BOTBODRAFT_173716 [Botryobasidium botryosum FD-172 SS1]|uniref:Ras GEF n=1 Tax=Botryobasidium botryosum (strain FD-172 SS1) TaxID=930990 RepID=A0A067MJ88_BOTB1|nr:hypothetical protein BOTBODRAFT_173716 [Botryobasidium botryosum FD-172 SS1]
MTQTQKMLWHGDHSWLTIASNPAYDARTIDSCRASDGDSVLSNAGDRGFAIALHDFLASRDGGYLPFYKGDILEILGTDGNGWWAGTLHGNLGWIPEAYVERISDKLAMHLGAIDVDIRVSLLEHLYEDLREGRMEYFTRDDGVQAYINARAAEASKRVHSKPALGDGSIRINAEGDVLCGTAEELVDYLTANSSLQTSRKKEYQLTFLMTFKSFISAEHLFNLLTERYRLKYPHNLSDAEYEEWEDKELHAVQKRILLVLESWIVHHRLLDTDAWIARKLIDFLSSIQTPESTALTAKQIIQTIESIGKVQAPVIKSPTGRTKSPLKRRNSKLCSKDFARIDVGVLAEHLTFMETQIYRKVRSGECLLWATHQTGDQVANLMAWRRMDEKLDAWVKMSVLNCDHFWKRADIIDSWILVAEKCKDTGNISSMTAIVKALTHVTIAELKLPWARVKNRTKLDPLVALADPANNYSAHRAFYHSLNGPCVPHLSQYLTAIEHIEEQYPDTLPGVNSFPMINFVKRTKWAEVISQMLKYQAYANSDDGAVDLMVMAFVQEQLNTAEKIEPGYFLARSASLQGEDAERADVRWSLAAAGFGV